VLGGWQGIATRTSISAASLKHPIIIGVHSSLLCLVYVWGVYNV
jgi:hypothetical protein